MGKNSLDELGVAEKFQSNMAIAGSFRNIFRYSLVALMTGGRALKRQGPIPGYQPLPNSEYCAFYVGSDSAIDNYRREKGNTPDRLLRSLI